MFTTIVVCQTSPFVSISCTVEQLSKGGFFFYPKSTFSLSYHSRLLAIPEGLFLGSVETRGYLIREMLCAGHHESKKKKKKPPPPVEWWSGYIAFAEVNEPILKLHLFYICMFLLLLLSQCCMLAKSLMSLVMSHTHHSISWIRFVPYLTEPPHWTRYWVWYWAPGRFCNGFSSFCHS